jgi:predicted dehydrogenase
MGKTDNETRAAASPLQVGLLADADEAPRYAEAVRRCPRLELCACGGMPQGAAPDGTEWFDDTRVLIAQGGIDVLLIGSSPRTGVSVGETALEHGVPVWRPPPLGRDFAEAVQVARKLEASPVTCRVASWWEHVETELRWALDYHAGCKPVFSQVQVSSAGPPLQSWRSSQVDAGGGVLAQDAYAALEALVALRGLPESAIGAIGKCRRRSSEAPRETEDVANAILRYENGGIVGIRATWDIAPGGQTTQHHGSELSARYDQATAAVLGPDGSVLEERALPPDFLGAEMGRLAADIIGETQPQAAVARIERHLAVSALLEAIYLSSRTGHPEIPRRLFEVQRWPEPEL